MQDRIVVENVTTAAGLVRARARGGERLRGHLRRQGARLRARRPAATRSRCPTRSSPRFDEREPARPRRRGDERRAHAGRVLASSARSTAASSATGSSSSRASAGSSTTDVVPQADERAEPRRRRSTASARSPRGAGLADAPAAGGDLGRARALLRALGLATSRRCGCAAATPGIARLPAAGHAVVHDRLRARHADHLVPDAPARPGARPRRARGARRAPGDRGRPVDRRRAGEDRPRGPARQGGQDLVPRATTGRSTRPRSTSSCSRRCGAGPTTTTLVERLREPALRALEWIDSRDRDGDGFVEYERRTERGLENQSWKDSGDSQRFADGRIADAADRAGRGAGLRLRREAADGRARPRGLARAGAGRAARARGGRSAGALRRGLLGEARRHYALALDGDKRARRLALLEHRPPALERDRPRRARRRRSSPR